MPITMQNTSAEEAPPVDVPLRPDNQPYRFEMFYDGFNSRAYADTADELIAFLIRGYDQMNASARLAARLHLAVRSQVLVQAEINASFNLNQVTPEEAVVLQGHRNNPPDVTEWNCEVPLVLVDVYYEPIGSLKRPASGIADVTAPDNVLWVSPADPYEFVMSLHNIGVVGLSEHITTVV
jgi:hypothetical protein